MPPHSVMSGLLIVFTALGALHAHSVGRPEMTSECPRTRFMHLQEMCSALNEALVNAEFNKDMEGVCRFYVQMLFCVAENLKECFEMYQEKIGSQYHHSPFYCGLDEDQHLKLQKLVFNSSGSSSETTPDSAPQPWTNGDGGGAKDGGGGAQTGEGVDTDKGYDIKTDSGSQKSSGVDGQGNHGTQEQHRGTSDNDKDSARHLASWSLWAVLLLAVTSGRLPWRLIS